jgi:hypothetical protein
MSYLTSRATASLLALVFALGACAEEDDPNYQNPSFPAITGDAQVVVMSKPPPAAEAGVSAPPAATMDARVPMVMQPVAPDGQVPDAGPPVVIGDGCNDIIQNAAIERECQTGGPMCTMQLDAIGKSLSELWAQMSKDGVQDVIHVMYSSAAGNPIKDRELNNQKLAESCAAVPPPLRCHLLNTDMIILEADMSSDGIHPSSGGYDKLGKAVFDLMVKEGMRR